MQAISESSWDFKTFAELKFVSYLAGILEFAM
jgi:hypothetical protein